MSAPTLRTERLLLRPLEMSDAAAIQRYAGDLDVARSTLTIPHPYEDGVAEAWIATHADAWDRRASLTLAVTEPTEGLVGVVGLELNLPHRRAEIGYWIAVPYWGRGYMTEAAGAVIEYGFDELGLNRIEAHHFVWNPASGRVMEKLGMQLEGVRRQHVFKDGKAEDLRLFAILAEDRGAGR